MYAARRPVLIIAARRVRSRSRRKSRSKRRHIPARYRRDGRHGSRGAGPNFNRLSYIVVLMSTAEQLGSLNAPQRKAVTYGEPLPGGKGFRAGPLLIVAGAGTGKTNTLAHRVAHLAMSGVDPARILMLTFTRRASIEMKRRANEIMREAFDDKLGGKASAISQRLTWAGTFHSIGNRLLRHYAKHVGLDPVLQRARSLRLGRPGRHRAHRARLFGQGPALPAQGHLPRDLFLPREHAEVAQGNARDAVLRGARTSKRTSASCCAPTSSASRSTACSISTTCCSTGTR